MRLLLMGNVLTPTQKLLNKFVAPGDEIAASYLLAGGAPTFLLYQHIGNRCYWRIELNCASLATGTEALRITTQYLVDFYRGHNGSSTPAVTAGGGVNWWSNANYVGGGYYQVNTVGQYLQLATNSDVEWVGGSFMVGRTDGYIMLCTIDGDNTLADLLPTAQNLVDAGTLPSSVLVANGGTLNPTDRVVDTYNLVTNNLTPPSYAVAKNIIFTKSLTKGQHTLRLTATAYKNNAASGTLHAYMFLLLSGGSSATGMSTTGCYPINYLVSDLDAMGVTPEISYAFKPTGGTNTDWLGHTGSEKFSILPTMTFDGSPYTLTTNETKTGKNIVMTMQFNIRHKDTGATNLGTVDMTYTLNSSLGMNITHHTVWATTGVVTGYPCMLAANHAIFDRYNTLGNTGIDLTHNDDSFNLNSDKQVAFCWSYAGYAAMILYVPDLLKTVNNWVECASNQKMYWADISANGGSWKKAYITRFNTASPRAFANAETWDSDTNYRVAWFSGGANAAMTS